MGKLVIGHPYARQFWMNRHQPQGTQSSDLTQRERDERDRIMKGESDPDDIIEEYEKEGDAIGLANAIRAKRNTYSIITNNMYKVKRFSVYQKQFDDTGASALRNLQDKLAKETDPIKKAKLQEKINKVQSRVDYFAGQTNKNLPSVVQPANQNMNNLNNAVNSASKSKPAGLMDRFRSFAGSSRGKMALGIAGGAALLGGGIYAANKLSNKTPEQKAASDTNKY